MNYGIGPLEWVPPSEFYPKGYFRARGGAKILDLRSNAQCGNAGVLDGVAFYASESPLDDAVIPLGSDLNGRVTPLVRSAWKKATSYEPTGETIVDLLRDQMTLGADPDGADCCKPIMPGRGQRFELVMGRPVKQWRCVPNGTERERQEWGVVQMMLKRQMAEVRTLALEGKLVSPRTKQPDLDYHRKFAKGLVEQGYPFEAIRPNDWPTRELPQEHDTEITDPFTNGNGVELSAYNNGLGWVWEKLDAGADTMEVFGDSHVRKTSPSVDNSRSFYRANIALSSVDQLAEIQFSNSSTGNTGRSWCAAVRVSDVSNCYFFEADRDGNPFAIWKKVGGTDTQLATTTVTPSLGWWGGIDAIGSTIRGLQGADGASQILSQVDTAHASGLYTGMLSYASSFAASMAIFEFHAKDFAVAGFNPAWAARANQFHFTR